MRLLALLWLTAQTEAACDPQGFDPNNAALDMARWRVHARPAVATARTLRAFGAYKFNASDGRETFPVSFGMVEGFPWPHRCDAEKYRRLHATARFRASDVAVASYPKTGTTWVEQIVLLLLHGTNAKLDPASRNTYNQRRNPLGCVWLEPMVASARRSRMTLAQFDDLPAPRVLKSHAPFDAFLGSRKGGANASLANLKATGLKTIYVARNPKDAAVSMYFQRAPLPSKRNRSSRRMPMDAWCALYMRGYVSCGAFAEHVTRWHAVSSAPASPVLFVTYEALKADPAAGVARIARFLGVARTEAEIGDVVRLSSFDAMAAQAARRPRPGDARNAKYAALSNGAVDRHSQAGHLRQGGTGTWVQHFSPLLSKQFDAAYRAAMGGAARRAALAFGSAVAAPAFDFGHGCVM